MLENENNNNISPENSDDFMEDNKGRFWRVEKIKDVVKLEDQLVTDLIKHADKLSAQIARFKGHSFDDMAAFVDLLGEKYGLQKGGKKGNITFTSFDGKCRVQVAVQDYLEFGAELQIAKSLIDKCIARWSDGADANIRVLVNHAFNVDKTGKVNREALFQLRKIEIDDEDWRQAINAINDSIRIAGSKTYIRFSRRENADDKFKLIPIDLAAA